MTCLILPSPSWRRYHHCSRMQTSKTWQRGLEACPGWPSSRVALCPLTLHCFLQTFEIICLVSLQCELCRPRTRLTPAATLLLSKVPGPASCKLSGGGLCLLGCEPTLSSLRGVETHGRGDEGPEMAPVSKVLAEQTQGPSSDPQYPRNSWAWLHVSVVQHRGWRILGACWPIQQK